MIQPVQEVLEPVLVLWARHPRQTAREVPLERLPQERPVVLHLVPLLEALVLQLLALVQGVQPGLVKLRAALEEVLVARLLVEMLA